MIDKNKPTNITDDINPDSTSKKNNLDLDKNINQPEDNKESNFTDLIEIKNEDVVNKNFSNTSSNIDSIEYVKKDDFYPEIYIKNFKRKSNINIATKTNSMLKEVADKNISEEEPLELESLDNESLPVDETTGTDKIESEEAWTLDDVMYLEDAEEVEEIVEELDNLEFLIEKIDKEKDEVDFPGKINLLLIDKKLSKPEIDDSDVDKEISPDSGESFGVKRTEVFYNIDKKIYSSRSATSSVITKIKDLKNGLFLPTMVVLISVGFLLLVIPLLSFYMKKTSSSTLEENFINDNSILAKIAKQKEEEARLARLKLDEEKKNLEYEKTKIQTTINEELVKKQTEIEILYKKKLADIEKQGGSAKQIELLKQQLEDERTKSLDFAKKELDKKLEDQKKTLDQKDKELQLADQKLKEAVKNKDFEVSKMTKDLEIKLKEKNTESENISLKLKEISETNRKIKDFNQMIYQLITGAINDFKNDNKESALLKLDSVLKYYDSRLEFVMGNEDLKNKMSTDIAFVQTITKLIQDSKNSSLYSDDFVKMTNKLKKISEYYKNGELFYNKKDWQHSGEEYAKALSEFEEINSSYYRMKDVEKQIQNAKALNFYNSALENIKNLKFDLAIKDLSTIIKEMPISDYSSQALNDIVRISDRLSTTTKVTNDNVKAKELFDKAKEYTKNKLYNEANNVYYEIILNYPYSDYTKDALKNSITLKDTIALTDNKQIDDKLRENFRTDYNKFVALYQKGDFKNAREYYFSALKNAFNIYSENSIPDFKTAEDKYINSLLDSNKFASDSNLTKQLEDTKAKLAKQFEDEKIKLAKQYNDDLEKQKTVLNKGQTNTEEVNKVKTYYEGEISKKNKEIENYKSKLISNVSDADLKNEKDNVTRLKNQLFELYKRYGELEQKLEKSESQSNVNIKKELADIQKKYKILEIQLEKSRKDLENKKSEIDAKMQSEIDSQVELKLKELKKDFDDQLEKINQNKDTKTTDTYTPLNLDNKFFGRIIEIVGNSVTFQYLSNDNAKDIKIGDKIKISRFIKTSTGDNKELNVGELEITLTSTTSLFGKGKVKSGINLIRVNDLLKK